MKNWTKRSAVIIALGVVGAAALAMRPAFCGDEALDCSFPGERAMRLPAGAGDAARLDVRYALDLSRPQGLSCFLHQDGRDAFALLQPATWTLHIRTAGGELRFDCDTPVLHAEAPFQQVQAEYVTSVYDVAKEKMPDNTYHDIYTIVAVCRVTVIPSFWQSPVQSVLLQSFRVDAQDGVVEPQTPSPSTMLAQAYGEPVYISRFPVQGLPQREGSTTRAGAALSQMFYALGRIDRPKLARAAAKLLPRKAELDSTLLPEPDAPWPDCWGEDAELAGDYARRIVDTLLYLQEKECFGSTGLADFINSPGFALYFGESFADKVQDPLDAPIGGFTIEKVSPDQLEDEEEDADDTTAEEQPSEMPQP